MKSSPNKITLSEAVKMAKASGVSMNIGTLRSRLAVYTYLGQWRYLTASGVGRLSGVNKSRWRYFLDARKGAKNAAELFDYV